MKLVSRYRIDLLLIILTSAILTYLLLATHVEKTPTGSVIVKIVAGCHIKFLNNDWQPSTVLVECPRLDSIRIFPFPIIYPYFEEPLDQDNQVTSSQRLVNARKLHKELLAAGLKVISFNSRGEVILDKDSAPENLSIVQVVIEKHIK